MKFNKRGFTLIELLAVISILAIVSVIVMYTSVNVIGEAKSKSYLTSVSNVEKTAGLYINDIDNNIVWKDNSVNNNLEYSCVTVKDLIEAGYFDSDVLKSMISDNRNLSEDDYVYIERNKSNKTITKNTLLVDTSDSLMASCIANKNNAKIDFSISPSGWSKEKEVTINYELVKFSGDYSNYSYKYSYIDIDEESKMDKKVVSKKIVVNNNGYLYAEIDDKDGKAIANKATVIGKIDNRSPQVELIVNDGNKYKKSNDFNIKIYDDESGLKKGNYKVYYDWSLNELSCNNLKDSSNSSVLELSVFKDGSKESSVVNKTISNKSGNGSLYVCLDYTSDIVGNEINDILLVEEMYLDNEKPVISLGNYTGNSIVLKSVVIPIRITDKYSGVNSSSFTYDDIIVKVGNKTISSGISLNKIDNNNFNLIVNNSADSGDIKLIINSGSVLDNLGNSNNGVEIDTGISFKNAYIISYDANGGSGAPSSQEKQHDVVLTLSSTIPSRTGYRFLGWSESSNATSATYNASGSFKKNANTILYAVWKPCFIPVFTYVKTDGSTAKYEIVDDDDNVISDPFNACVDNWKIRFLEDGTLTITDLKSASNGIDIFLVAGGGTGSEGSRYQGTAGRGGGGGGGGASITVNKFPVKINTSYTLDIGAASANTIFKVGSTTYYTALKGSNGNTSKYINNSGWTEGPGYGGDGGIIGSTFVAGGKVIDSTGDINLYGALSIRINKGSNGGDGGSTSSGKNGTYEFNGTSGKRYGAGGGGSSIAYCSDIHSGASGGSIGGGKGGTGCYQECLGNNKYKYVYGASGKVGTANTGSGGGGGGGYCGSGDNSYGGNGAGAKGGSGIIIIRNTRS